MDEWYSAELPSFLCRFIRPRETIKLKRSILMRRCLTINFHPRESKLLPDITNRTEFKFLIVNTTN